MRSSCFYHAFSIFRGVQTLRRRGRIGYRNGFENREGVHLLRVRIPPSPPTSYMENCHEFEEAFTRT